MPAVCSCWTSVRPRGLQLDNPSFVSYHLLKCRRRHARQQGSGARQCSRLRWSRSRRAGCTGRRRRTSRAPPASRSRTSSACSGRRRSSSSRRSSAAWPTRWSSSARPRATVAGRSARGDGPGLRRDGHGRPYATSRPAAGVRGVQKQPEVREEVRSGFGSLHLFVETVSGLGPERVAQWFAKGMLLNVVAAMDLSGGRASRGRAACSRARSIPSTHSPSPGSGAESFYLSRDVSD